MVQRPKPDETDDLGLSSDSEEHETLISGASGHDADLREYGKSIGVDVDLEPELAWVVQEAFVANLPPSWSEHTDDEHRIYFFNQASQQSSWSHPMDAVFREIIDIVKKLRTEQASEQRRHAAVQEHIQEVHARAIAQLDGWSGPYAVEGGGSYFHHAASGASTWDNPVEEWQSELSLRQQVLYRCLLSSRPVDATVSSTVDGADTAAETKWFSLPLLKLNLSMGKIDGVVAPPSPSSSRSFHTARSARSTCSARSPRANKRLAYGADDVLAALDEVVADSSEATTAASQEPASETAAEEARPLLPIAPRPNSHSPRRCRDGEDLEFTFGTGAALRMPPFTRA